MKSITIKIHESFVKFFIANTDEFFSSISPPDAVRFAGPACPAIVGALMISRHAMQKLFPGSQICERDDVQVYLSSELTGGATGSISNFFFFHIRLA